MNDLTKQEKDQLDKEIFDYYWKYDDWMKTVKEFDGQYGIKMTKAKIVQAVLRGMRIKNEKQG